MSQARADGVSLPAGRTAVVTTPASAANLGPGFDTFGLALDWADTCAATVTDEPSQALVTGEAADRMPTDGRHLVIRSIQHGLASLDAPAPGLELRAHNTIPHSRGLGSSSAAIVSGLALAWGLARPDSEPDLEWMVNLATELEGHPDNVAAAIHGGFVIAYVEGAGVRVVRADIRPEITAVVYVPDDAVSTHAVRQLLPGSVPHADAAANSARSALLVHALTARPDLLLDATRDWLHTDYRRAEMPASYELLRDLRHAGHAAVISGAGPTVLVLGTAATSAALPDPAGFVRRPIRIGAGVRLNPGSA